MCDDGEGVNLKNLLLRVENLEKFIFSDFIKKVQKIVEWHDHGTSGKMYWNLPPELMFDELKKEILKAQEMVGNKDTKNKKLMKAGINRPTDEIDFKKNYVTKNETA